MYTKPMIEQVIFSNLRKKLEEQNCE